MILQADLPKLLLPTERVEPIYCAQGCQLLMESAMSRYQPTKVRIRRAAVDISDGGKDAFWGYYSLIQQYPDCEGEAAYNKWIWEKIEEQLDDIVENGLTEAEQKYLFGDVEDE